MKKLILFTTALFLGFSVLSAQPNKMPIRQGSEFSQRGMGIQNPNCRLDLTEEQQEQMKDLRLEHQNNVMTIKNEMGVLAAEQKVLMSGDDQNLNDINKKIDEMQVLRTDLLKMSVKHRLEVRDLLTDEQKVLFDSKKVGSQKKFKGKSQGMRNSRNCRYNQCYYRR
ncbi:MAG: Spy/CpxP family protein refolding chaperone [Bacteroidales bacterium]|nr:Spy/CpxP family protein refolding chaperone [Bacteroidales bacterium]